MNSAYRIVWNSSKRCLVVVSEIAKSKGKTSSERAISSVISAESLQPFYSTDPPPLKRFKLKQAKYPVSMMGGLSLMTAAVAVGVPTGVYAGNCATGPYTGGNTGCVNTSSMTSLTNSGGSITANGTVTSTIGSTIIGSSIGIWNESSISTLNNAGTISGYWFGITNYSYNAGSIGTLINSGLISSSHIALINSEIIGTLINSGTINTTNNTPDAFVAIYNLQGTIGVLSNTGTILGAVHSSGIWNDNGVIGALNNLQGVNGTTNNALIYEGTLPNQYNVIINSPIEYGELSAYLPIEGSMAFGISGLSTISSIGTLASTLTNVLEGFSGTLSGSGISKSIVGSEFAVTNILGAIDGRSYALAEDISISGNWNLVFAPVTAYGISIASGSIASTVTNSDVLAGTIAGVYNDGTIGNLLNSGGIIDGGIFGIQNNASIGSLTNSGSISGVNIGIYNAGSRDITEISNLGVISGDFAGIVNYGSISTISNASVGTIIGIASGGAGKGIDNNGAIGLLTNSGKIISSGNDGIGNSGLIGTIENLVGGTITGLQYAGIENFSTGSITKVSNDGLISGLMFGFNNELNGTIDYLLNSSTATIEAAARGIQNKGVISSLINSGKINGNSRVIYNNGTIGALSNSGTISGGSTGVFNSLWSPDSGVSYIGGIIDTLSNSGSISGGSTGVYNNGTIGALSNSGTITGLLFAINSGVTIRTITNTGLISGNIRITGQDVYVLGGSSGTIGTLSGGTINLSSGNQLNFGTGNQLVSDVIGTVGGVSINAGSGGTVTFGVDNSYTGLTTISSGTLQVGAGDTIGSLGTGDVVDNAALAFNRSDSITIGNTISGSGSLSQIGTGSLILTADNSYTGLTTISSGSTLALIGSGAIADSSSVGADGTFDISGSTSGASITSLSGTGGVTLGSHNLSLTNATGSFSGTISGAGGLSLTGGTETLTGTNTYTGSTTVEAGTLVIGAGGTTGSLGTGAIVNNATLAFNRSDTITLGNIISGSGSLNQISSSSLILTANNSYTGATNISSGSTLALSGSGAIAGSSVAADGTFDISGSTSGASITSLSGSGDVALGANTLSLSNAAGSFGGSITGTGGLELNAGSETLTGTNTYTGGTQVNAGANLIINSGAALGTGTLALVGSATVPATLSITATTTIDNAIAVEGDPTFDVASGTTTTIASSITDGSTAGDLVLTGGGKLLLNAANTYTGSTTVEAGNLVIGDSDNPLAQITSPTTVNNGGTLSGYGTVSGSVTVASGGTVAPGSTGAVGALNIIGNYTQNAGSNLDVNVTPTSASKLNITGTASLLGGTVNATALAGTSNLLSKYTLLSASGGVTGTYSSLLSNFAFLSPTLTYDANDVYLSFISNQADYASVATNTNQTAVATGLDRASGQTNSAAGQSILSSLDGMSATQAQAAFDSLSGEGLSAQQSVNFEATELVVDTARRQSTYWLMDECQTGASSKKNKAAGQNSVPTTCAGETNKKFRSWIAGVGGSSSMDGSSSVGSASVSTRTGGGIVGFDYEVSSHLLVGGMVGGTSSNYNVSARASSGTDSSGQVGLYSVAKWNSFYVNSIFNYGYFSGDTTRYVTGVGTTSEQTGKTSSNAFTGRMEVGYRMDHPLLNVMPFVAMQATSLQMNRFNESNSNNLGLSVDGDTTMSEPGSLGVQLDRAFDINEKWSMYPLIRMAWVHEFQTSRSINASLQALPTANWTVNGASAAPNSANVGISFQAMNKNGLAFFASGDVDASSTTQSYMGQVGFKLLW